MWKYESAPSASVLGFVNDETLLLRIHLALKVVNALSGEVQSSVDLPRSKFPGLSCIVPKFGGHMGVAVMNHLYLWKEESPGDTLQKLRFTHPTPYSAAVSPDNTMLAFGSLNGEINFWRVNPTWTHVACLSGHLDSVSQVAFSRDGKHLISNDRRHILIWDISALVEGREFDIPEDQEGILVRSSWFRHGIPLGGWLLDEPFEFRYPFPLLPEVKPLNWDFMSQ